MKKLADVLSSALLLASHYEIDVQQAVVDKLSKNAQKYAIAESWGKDRKYDERWRGFRLTVVLGVRVAIARQTNPPHSRESLNLFAGRRGNARVRATGTGMGPAITPCTS